MHGAVKAQIAGTDESIVALIAVYRIDSVPDRVQERLTALRCSLARRHGWNAVVGVSVTGEHAVFPPGPAESLPLDSGRNGDPVVAAAPSAGGSHRLRVIAYVEV